MGKESPKKIKIIDKNFLISIGTLLFLNLFIAFLIKPEKGLNFSISVLLDYIAVLLGYYLGKKYALSKKVSITLIAVLAWGSLIVWYLPPLFALVVPSFVYSFVLRYPLDFKHKKTYKILSMVGFILSVIVSVLFINLVKFGNTDIVHYIARALGY
jgi:hypothetical protein